jgi:S-DNA-T family DNA segregation ATPase FtsK/SpoIIIE
MMDLKAIGIRIIAPIPGRGTVGIEVPNKNPEIVTMESLITSAAFQNSKYELPLAIGKTISNESYVIDLAKCPHLLVAGATGQGKSVGLNAIIASILYKKHPAEVKFVLVDPKKVELTLYNKIEKHYLAKLPESEDAIITDVDKVKQTLNSLTVEMDNRYDLLKEAECRNIKEYNAKFIARRLNPERGHKFLPYIIVVIDEFADLIMTAGKEVEKPLARIAQLARAIGIHLIVATQRPTTNIITGTIKANFPSRIAFKVSSAVDSKTILDTTGANHLIGRGDMLVQYGSDGITRLQCAFIDTPELEKITEFIGSQRGYPTTYELPEPDIEAGDEGEAVDLSKRDSMFEEAARIIVTTQQGSTSMLQRKLEIGYNRAGRIMDQLEAAGIVGPAEGSKPRKVYLDSEYALEQFIQNLDRSL